jgi:DNA polymerase-1
MDTSAIMGFMNSLMDVIKEKPDHLAVAFDNGGSQLKRNLSEYKAHRDATPEAIKMLFLISITEGDAYPYY